MLGMGSRRGLGVRGTTALEFGILSFPFMLFIMFLFELGMDFYIQIALDYAVTQAARAIQTGAAQSTTSSAAFKALYVCPPVSGLLNCNQISINSFQVTTDFYSQGAATVPTVNGKVSTGSWGFCAGQANSLMEVQAIYISTSLVGGLLPSMAMATTQGLQRITQSTMGFLNEPFTGADASGC